MLLFFNLTSAPIKSGERLTKVISAPAMDLLQPCYMNVLTRVVPADVPTPERNSTNPNWQSNWFVFLDLVHRPIMTSDGKTYYFSGLHRLIFGLCLFYPDNILFFTINFICNLHYIDQYLSVFILIFVFKSERFTPAVKVIFFLIFQYDVRILESSTAWLKKFYTTPIYGYGKKIGMYSGKTDQGLWRPNFLRY